MARHLRPAAPEDTEQICALLGAVFEHNRKADPGVYAWQYWDNPFGPPHSQVWDDDGRIVAHGGLYAVPGEVEGTAVRMGRTADSATARSCRGQGLFGALARRRFEEAAAAGVTATVAIPNPNSLPGLEQAGLARIARLQAWVRPLDLDWAAQRSHLPVRLLRVGVRTLWGPSPPATAGEEVDAPPAGLDELPGPGAGIRRDHAWWTWRYAHAPAGSYRYFAHRRRGRLTGAAATTVAPHLGAPFLHVMEWQAVDELSARSVLAAALTAAGDCAGAVLLAAPRSIAATWAGACGFRRVPRPLEPRPMIMGVIGHGRPTAALAGLPWTVSWGDHDHL